MSIDEQPMNVYWSGQKSPTSNKYKINYKGTVASASALPATGNKKGDTYNISEDGSDYIWTGAEWNKFGANIYIGATDTANGIQGLVPVATSNQMYSLLTGMGTWQSAEDLGLALNNDVVHKTGDEEIAGTKTFSSYINGIAKDLRIVGLGSNYEMKASDFGGYGGMRFVADFKTNTTSAPEGNSGDYRFIKLDNNPSFSVFLCKSPRDSKIFWGRFWDGVWQGWFQIFNERQNIVFSGDAHEIKVKKEDSLLYLSGGYTAGASLSLSGKNRENNAGKFILKADDGTSNKELVGVPSGTLTWNGQTIQTTSDERYKTTLATIPGAVLDAWGEVQWGQFQYLEAVAEKGESARFHTGLIAQRVKQVFKSHGLDACKYGILCHETRPEVDEQTEVEDVPAYTDEEGVEHPAVTHIEYQHEDAVDLWMVRYDEAQAMEAAYQRRRAERAEARIKALEDRLSALEEKLV